MNQVPEISTITSTPGELNRSEKKRRFPFLNFPFIITIILLVAYGLLVVWAAVYDNELYSFTRQAQGVAIGAVVMVLLWRFDYRNLSNFTTILIIINVVLILSPNIPFLGVEAKGAQSWINLFGVQIQPGEFAKFTVILLAASVVSKYGGTLNDPKEYLKTLGILLIPFVCIMTQPDLGTGLVYLFIGAVALIMGGARVRYLLITLAVGIALLSAVFALDAMFLQQTGEYKLIKEYQRARLLVFFDQNYSQTDEGWNLNQAKIAIGSGGLFGKGLLNTTQASLGYLPEAPTDFIFCVLAEALGFFGVLTLLGLYIALVLICFRIARRSSDLFGMLIVMCTVGMWLFQIMENIGMTCGLMPITGIPLPFMSYGSSFMLLNFALLGLVGSVSARSSR